MTIPPRFLDEIRDRLSLSDIIGRRVKIVRAGREFKACCPFHHEKSPSFTINDDKQFYHCFGCGVHGDVLDFVMKHDNRSFMDAVEMLAAEAGLQVPQQTPQEIEKAKKAKGVYELLNESADYFSSILHDTKWEREKQYLLERGMSERLMGLFRVGFAPVDDQALRKHLLAQGYTDGQMIEAGVTRASTKGREPYGFFRDRIMFPVADRQGRVVAFGGRILPDHLRPPSRQGSNPPKYINSSDTDLFHKGRMLYGEAQARQASGAGKPVIVVEGYMDVMASFQGGFEGAVAPMGTALTEDQIAILWKMIPSGDKTPILCLDGDEAGRRAAARACERFLPLLKPDHSARFAFLPEGEDPDSLIRARGKQAFQSILDSAMPLVDFLWMNHTANRRFETPESRAGLSKTLEDETARIIDRTVQQYYRQVFREKLYDAFGKKAFMPQKRKPGYVAGGAPVPVSMPLRRPATSDDNLPQKILLAALINHPVLFESVEEDLGHMQIKNERLDSLRQAVLNLFGGSSDIDSAALLDHLSKQGYALELRSVLSELVYTHAGFARPGVEEGEVLTGWQKTWSFAHRKTALKELTAAGQALAQDFSAENERKVIAFHDVNKEEED